MANVAPPSALLRLRKLGYVFAPVGFIFVKNLLGFQNLEGGESWGKFDLPNNQNLSCFL